MDKLLLPGKNMVHEMLGKVLCLIKGEHRCLSRRNANS